ncbi:DUF3540 domain-containing protein [Oceanobacter mangrovi]|uniref:DUF3540 domain-containing protein n=1 Tax=Oceanobacter mangrovi TaxID=2862510 RepID=UPI001C8D5A04|nr:DUF3540 domain-containing protein [Oceanobacter mangrovi]
MSANIHNLPEKALPLQESGHVIGQESRFWLVRTSTGVHRSRRSFDCLIAPQLADKVVVMHVDGEHWVTHILDREDTGEVSLQTEGNLTLCSKNGSVQMVGLTVRQHAQQSLEQYGAKVSVTSQAEVHTTGKLALASQETVFQSLQLDAKADRAVFSVGTLMQKVKSSVRQIQDAEIVTAGQLVHKIRNCFKSHSKNTILTSDQDIKVDAKRIHMG